MNNDNVIPLKPVEAKDPEPRTFEFKFLDAEGYDDGETVTKTGFLMCTPQFVGIGTADGLIVGVAPLSTLKHVFETPAA